MAMRIADARATPIRVGIAHVISYDQGSSEMVPHGSFAPATIHIDGAPEFTADGVYQALSGNKWAITTVIDLSLVGKSPFLVGSLGAVWAYEGDLAAIATLPTGYTQAHYDQTYAWAEHKAGIAP